MIMIIPKAPRLIPFNAQGSFHGFKSCTSHISNLGHTGNEHMHTCNLAPRAGSGGRSLLVGCRLTSMLNGSARRQSSRFETLLTRNCRTKHQDRVTLLHNHSACTPTAAGTTTAAGSFWDRSCLTRAGCTARTSPDLGLDRTSKSSCG
jgi:hypothetical protein